MIKPVIRPAGVFTYRKTVERAYITKIIIRYKDKGAS